MVYRLILPNWAKEEHPELPKVLEGEFTKEELSQYNNNSYNIYYLPNGPKVYEAGTTVDGSQIDQFDWAFVDMDLKDNIYKSKEEFI